MAASWRRARRWSGSHRRRRLRFAISGGCRSAAAPTASTWSGSTRRSRPNRRVGKANGSRECAPDDCFVGWAKRSVPIILTEPMEMDGGHGAKRAPLPTLRFRNRLQGHAQSVARLGDRPDLPFRRVAGLQRDFEVLQEMPREAFRLHVGKMQPEAHMGAAAERHPGEAMAVALGFL